MEETTNDIEAQQAAVEQEIESPEVVGQQIEDLSVDDTKSVDTASGERSQEATNDIEAPQAVEQKIADVSKAVERNIEEQCSDDDTKSLDTASERTTCTDDSSSDAGAKDANHPQCSDDTKKRFKTIAFIAVIVLIFGLTVGLGFGLTNQNSSAVSSVHLSEEQDKTPSKKPFQPPPEHGTPVSSDPLVIVDFVDPPEEIVDPPPEDSIEEPMEPENPDPPSKPAKDPVGGGEADHLQWPELVGMSSQDAVEYLQDLYGDTYHIVTVPYGGFVTKDYRTDRIIIYLDLNDEVKNVPGVG